jgi:hypothetical protein
MHVRRRARRVRADRNRGEEKRHDAETKPQRQVLRLRIGRERAVKSRAEFGWTAMRSGASVRYLLYRKSASILKLRMALRVAGAALDDARSRSWSDRTRRGIRSTRERIGREMARAGALGGAPARIVPWR